MDVNNEVIHFSDYQVSYQNIEYFLQFEPPLVSSNLINLISGKRHTNCNCTISDPTSKTDLGLTLWI